MTTVVCWTASFILSLQVLRLNALEMWTVPPEAWPIAEWNINTPVPEQFGGSTLVLLKGEIILSGSGGTYVYNPNTEYWTEAGKNKPIPCNNHEAAVSHKGKVYYFGGYGKTGSTKDSYQCCTDSTDRTCSVTTYAGQQAKVVILENLATDKWTVGATVPYNVHGSMAATSIGDFIYVCGGIYMQDPKNVKWPANPSNCAKYNPQNDKFTSIASMPYGVDSASAASDGKSMFIFGGRQAERRMSSDAFDFVQMYSPATDTWTSHVDSELHKMPAPRASTAAVYHEGNFWVLGGESKQVGAHNDVFLFNPGTNSWRTAAPLPSRFHGMGAVIDPAINVMYTAGGGKTSIGYESDAMFTLNPCIPAPSDLDSKLAACGKHRQCNEGEYCEQGASGEGEANFAGCKPCPYCLASSTICPVKCNAFTAAFMEGKSSGINLSQLQQQLKEAYPARAHAESGSYLLCQSTTTTTTTTVRRCTDGRLDRADCNLNDRGCKLPSVVGIAYRGACPVQCGLCKELE